MHPSGSMIKTALEHVRDLLNDASIDAKYDNAYIVRNHLARSVSTVFSRASMMMDNPIIMRYTIDLVAGQEYYQCPPAVQSVLRLARSDNLGQVEQDWRPRNEFHPHGPGWILDGNTVRFRPIPQNAESWELWYTPSINVPIHYAEDGTKGATTTEFNLSASPSLGNRARFENELDGQILRILTGTIWYERVISSYDATNNKVTLRTPVTLPDGNIAYEVCPAGYIHLWEAASCLSALNLGTGRKITDNHYGRIQQLYNVAVKTIRDNLSYLQLRTGKGFEKMTIDHPELTFGIPARFGI